MHNARLSFGLTGNADLPGRENPDPLQAGALAPRGRNSRLAPCSGRSIKTCKSVDVCDHGKTRLGRRQMAILSEVERFEKIAKLRHGIDFEDPFERRT